MRQLDGVISPAQILTAQEEIKILRELLEAKDLKKTIIGSGSARIVFDSNYDYVIKLGIGESGYLQNMRELERFQEDKDTGFLAVLEGVGRFVLLQEKVLSADEHLRDIFGNYDMDDPDFEDCVDEIMECLECSEEDARDMAEVYKTACDYYGETTDNAQMGKTEHRGWVLYDYGYVPGEDSNQASGMSYILTDNINELRDYIQYCINLLEAAIAEDEMLVEMRKADKAIHDKTPLVEKDEAEEEETVEEEEEEQDEEEEDTSEDTVDFRFE